MIHKTLRVSLVAVCLASVGMAAWAAFCLGGVAVLVGFVCGLLSSIFAAVAVVYWKEIP